MLLPLDIVGHIVSFSSRRERALLELTSISVRRHMFVLYEPSDDVDNDIGNPKDPQLRRHIISQLDAELDAYMNEKQDDEDYNIDLLFVELEPITRTLRFDITDQRLELDVKEADSKLVARLKRFGNREIALK